MEPSVAPSTLGKGHQPPTSGEPPQPPPPWPGEPQAWEDILGGRQLGLLPSRKFRSQLEKTETHLFHAVKIQHPFSTSTPGELPGPSPLASPRGLLVQVGQRARSWWILRGHPRRTLQNQERVPSPSPSRIAASTFEWCPSSSPIPIRPYGHLKQDKFNISGSLPPPHLPPPNGLHLPSPGAAEKDEQDKEEELQRGGVLRDHEDEHFG